MNEPKPVSKYTLTWITAQIPAAVVVWLSHAQNHIQPVVTALIGGIWMFLSTFAIKVWKEIEDDAIKSTAGIVRSVPRAVSALCVRAWGWVGGAVAGLLASQAAIWKRCASSTVSLMTVASGL